MQRNETIMTMLRRGDSCRGCAANRSFFKRAPAHASEKRLQSGINQGEYDAEFQAGERRFQYDDSTSTRRGTPHSQHVRPLGNYSRAVLASTIFPNYCFLNGSNKILFPKYWASEITCTIKLMGFDAEGLMLTTPSNS